jgi:preprotein translocase subunit SecG
MLLGLLLVVQILISIFMVVVILLQSSKGGGLAGIAGGLSSSTVFGGRGAANFLTKATTVLATLFFMNCLGMAVLTAHQEGITSVTQQAVRTEGTASPVPAFPGGQTISTTEGDPATTPVSSTPQPTAETTEPATTPAEESSGDGN